MPFALGNSGANRPQSGKSLVIILIALCRESNRLEEIKATFTFCSTCLYGAARKRSVFPIKSRDNHGTEL